jgi:glycosyltransferase involved in cell wall biosynthesis
MKVAVYTIALNEAAHAERWANSAVDADYRIVADTGSTDGTVELLRAAGVTVHQIAIKPWRFDDARNAALALIPADVDICCSMDMDRFLTPGWRETLEAVWRPETTAMMNQIHYRRSVDDPQILRSFPVKNFHTRWGYRFRRPVHEALYYSGQEVVHGTGDLVMAEVQDLTKDTRHQYLPLMELAHREDPDDGQICFWLGREYMYADRPDEGAPLLERYLGLPTSGWSEERSEAMRYLSRMQPDRKMYWLDRARTEAPHRRETWLDLAEEFHAREDWLNLFWASANGIEKTRITNSYLDSDSFPAWRPYDLGAIAAWRLGAIERAIEWGRRAVELDPSSDRLKSNLEFFRQASTRG